MTLIKILVLSGIVLAGTASTPIIIDVRTQAEYDNSHIVGAEHIDITSADFDKKIAKLDKNATYEVYCKKGVRAENAAIRMRALGLKANKGTGIEDLAKKLKQKCEGKSTVCG